MLILASDSSRIRSELWDHHGVRQMLGHLLLLPYIRGDQVISQFSANTHSFDNSLGNKHDTHNISYMSAVGI